METFEKIHQFPSKLLRLAGRNSVVVELCGRESNFILSNAQLMRDLNQIPMGVEWDYQNCPITLKGGVDLYSEYAKIHPYFKLHITPGSNLANFWMYEWQLRKQHSLPKETNYVLLLDTCDISDIKGFVNSVDHLDIPLSQMFFMLNTATCRVHKALETADRYIRNIYGNTPFELVDSLEYYNRTGTRWKRTFTLYKPL